VKAGRNGVETVAVVVIVVMLLVIGDISWSRG